MKEMKKLWDKVEKVSEKVIAATKQKDPSGTLVGKSIKVGIYTVRLESIIGEGGYACIYKARDINTGDVFALKHLRISPDAESAELVQREARTMSRLRGHPNILRLHAAAFLGPAGAETECFMLMEYCPNTLLDLLHKTSFQLDEATILDVFTAVCEGVCHMHRQNPPLTHRDLKAENVLRSAGGQWVLCDFGSATARAQVYETTAEIATEEENIRRTTTPAYRAPEMWDLYARQRIDTKSDIWALGVLLYVLLFGRLPFQGDSKLQVLYGKYDMPATARRSDAIKSLVPFMLVVNPLERPDIYRLLAKVDEVKGALGVRGHAEFAAATQNAGPPPPAPLSAGAARAGAAGGGGSSRGREGALIDIGLPAAPAGSGGSVTGLSGAAGLDALDASKIGPSPMSNDWAQFDAVVPSDPPTTGDGAAADGGSATPTVSHPVSASENSRSATPGQSRHSSIPGYETTGGGGGGAAAADAPSAAPAGGSAPSAAAAGGSAAAANPALATEVEALKAQIKTLLSYSQGLAGRVKQLEDTVTWQHGAIHKLRTYLVQQRSQEQQRAQEQHAAAAAAPLASSLNQSSAQQPAARGGSAGAGKKPLAAAAAAAATGGAAAHAEHGWSTFDDGENREGAAAQAAGAAVEPPPAAEQPVAPPAAAPAAEVAMPAAAPAPAAAPSSQPAGGKFWSAGYVEDMQGGSGSDEP